MSTHDGQDPSIHSKVEGRSPLIHAVNSNVLAPINEYAHPCTGVSHQDKSKKPVLEPKLGVEVSPVIEPPQQCWH